MAKVLPPKGFAGSSLQLHVVPAGKRFGRIDLERYADPLGVGKSPGRFSNPRRRIARNRFGVHYLGETVLRDQRDSVIGDLPIAVSELHTRLYAEINVNAPLNLVDLRGAGAVIMGVPTDVAKASSQTLARKWSLAFHEHHQQPDGIIYPIASE